jgi:hypothetical protein
MMARQKKGKGSGDEPAGSRCWREADLKCCGLDSQHRTKNGEDFGTWTSFTSPKQERALPWDDGTEGHLISLTPMLMTY